MIDATSGSSGLESNTGSNFTATSGCRLADSRLGILAVLGAASPDLARLTSLRR